MTRVPQVLPKSLDSCSLGSSEAAELARLEAHRDWLLDMIAHQERPKPAKPAPLWFYIVMLFIIAGLGLTLFAGVTSGQIAASFLVWTAVIVGLIIFVAPLRVRLFGTSFYAVEIVALVLSGWTAPDVLILFWIGGPDTRALLADCEAKISRLKADRL